MQTHTVALKNWEGGRGEGNCIGINSTQTILLLKDTDSVSLRYWFCKIPVFCNWFEYHHLKTWFANAHMSWNTIISNICRFHVNMEGKGVLYSIILYAILLKNRTTKQFFFNFYLFHLLPLILNMPKHKESSRTQIGLGFGGGGFSPPPKYICMIQGFFVCFLWKVFSPPTWKARFFSKF